MGEILCVLMSFKDGLWPLLVTRNNLVLLGSLCSMMLAMPLVLLRSLMLKPQQLVNLWVPRLLNLPTWQVTNWCMIGFTAVSETMSHIGLESPETPTETLLMLALEMLWHLLCGMMVSPTILATTKIALMSIRIQILMFKANGTIGAAITKQDLFAKLPLLLLKSN